MPRRPKDFLSQSMYRMSDFDSGALRLMATFFGENFSIVLSIYEANCLILRIVEYPITEVSLNRFKPTSKARNTGELAPEERTRTRTGLNLRFSLGVQGLNQGSGLNFGAGAYKQGCQ